ncbi:epoxide hydrolase, putative [Talaromyces stipitatus ATCC 10500]|uniref:Epoxide hydrolase, putative n=1 Tax=Talaromyces stipitatus (strain ATCC 10500 / CBS 375.48 / QM 6759 / NRRL 1006) TaxID=441959 RepID=B8MIF8_TALSN|nr:epoxide hydrolase, putative [Talaromyces stipitatus ATCC 10500]EED14642.1 epoxide hydrolase, putative [Talaromyces stipitatus ATCC 10500]
MALHLFPEISKTTTVRDGTKYSYIHVPPSDSNKPTFLLLHGFPSTSYDWRHVLPLLKDRGYGVIAPDLLGYGDSDNPAEVEAYSIKRMADHVIEVILSEGLEQVIGVGHDWGSTLLSTAALTYPDRFSGLTFTAVGFVPPEPFDLKSVNTMVKEYIGYPAFAYMDFFNEDSAAAICDKNPASVMSMLYSTKPDDWKAHMGAEGGAKEWVSCGKVAHPPPWMSYEEIATHVQLLKKGGYTGPLNWYKSFIRGIDKSLYERFTTDESKNLDIPAVVVTAAYDCGSRPEFQIPAAEKHLSNRRIERFECGHWIPLERPKELVILLEEFASGL